MKQIIKKAFAVALAACLVGAVSTPALARGHHGFGGFRGGGFRSGGFGGRGFHRGGFHGGGFRGGGFHGFPHHRWHGHHRHWHGSYGFYMDLTPAFWYPWYYRPYYPYYGSSTVIVQQPVQYVSREDDNGDYYWYYCHNPQGYYPYISQCNSRWVKVRPFPADAQK